MKSKRLDAYLIYQKSTVVEAMQKIDINTRGILFVVKQVYMSTENSVNRSLKTRSLLTKFGTCNITATGAVTI